MNLEERRAKQIFLQHLLPHLQHLKLKKGTLDGPILSCSDIERFVSFKRHLLACHFSLKHIVVKVISINNGIEGIDYFQIAVVLHNMVLAAQL